MAKPCPITRSKFRESAQPVRIEINGNAMIAQVKEFSTKSFGWYLNGKTVIEVAGIPVNVQIGMNLTVVGSKDAVE